MKDKNIVKKIQEDNSGFSFIELIIAIVLLTVIIGAFLTSFEVSTKTNITSGKVVDSGYLAQTCMEHIYQLSIDNDINGIKSVMTGDGEKYGYAYTNPSSNNHVFKKKIEKYDVKIKMITNFNNVSQELIKVEIDVYEDANLIASVQNIITLEEG